VLIVLFDGNRGIVRGCGGGYREGVISVRYGYIQLVVMVFIVICFSYKRKYRLSLPNSFTKRITETHSW
jgi:hypothetical protein